MSETERTTEARRWLAFATGDLANAELLAEDESGARNATWLAQQAAEKSLKAALVFLGIAFPPRHDLNLLQALLPDGWSVRGRQLELADLTSWTIVARYPGDWPEPTLADARGAVAQARDVLSLILLDMRSEGFASDSG